MNIWSKEICIRAEEAYIRSNSIIFAQHCMNKRQWMEGSQQTSFHEHGCEDGTMREDGMDRPHIVLHVWLQITISSACFHKHKFEDGTMRKDGMVQQHIVLHLWLQIR
ncbi:hypothetical protein C0J52_10018 [Blattella germanica]|nr:hypothetical protein C0J52_10018 [Blattella germanica]